MSNIPDNLRYTREHEWVRKDDEFVITCGITDHAQAELTDVVFVELPEVGREVLPGDQLCIVESVKAVSDVFAPMTGRVTEVNNELEDSPELVNQSPYEKGWMFTIEFSDPNEYDNLLTAEQYAEEIE
jgi:glycine cleavage system H protein